MIWGRLAALAAGGAALCWLLSSVGFDAVIRNVAKAGFALPAAIVIHAVQLGLSGIAWHRALGPGAPSVLTAIRIRWIREGVNTLLPMAQIGGQIVGVRLLVQAGTAATLAVAGIILDLTVEAGAQLLVILAAVASLLLLRQGNHAWFGWVTGGVTATALVVGALIAVQRFGLLRLVEAALARAASRWPDTAGWSMVGLHATLMRRQADLRAMAAAMLLHCASWSLGALEVWVILQALGHPVGLAPAFVIESLAMAARSAGFAVPGAVGVQEGGFVLVCGLFGIDAETAVALSLLKRLRELCIGAGALLAWQLPGRQRARL